MSNSPNQSGDQRKPQSAQAVKSDSKKDGNASAVKGSTSQVGKHDGKHDGQSKTASAADKSKQGTHDKGVKAC